MAIVLPSASSSELHKSETGKSCSRSKTTTQTLLLCACTYVLGVGVIEQDSRDIVNIVSVDKRETNRNSVIMEKECFVRTMEKPFPELAIKEVVTDAHPQITALLSKFFFFFFPFFII